MVAQHHCCHQLNSFDEFYAAVDKCPSNNIYKADTLEELADKFGMTPEVLVAAVERYTGLCPPLWFAWPDDRAADHTPVCGV